MALPGRCEAKHAPEHECNLKAGHAGRHLCWQGCPSVGLLSAPSKRWVRRRRRRRASR